MKPRLLPRPFHLYRIIACEGGQPFGAERIRLQNDSRFLPSRMPFVAKQSTGPVDLTHIPLVFLHSHSAADAGADVFRQFRSVRLRGESSSVDHKEEERHLYQQRQNIAEEQSSEL